MKKHEQKKLKERSSRKELSAVRSRKVHLVIGCMQQRHRHDEQRTAD